MINTKVFLVFSASALGIQAVYTGVDTAYTLMKPPVIEGIADVPAYVTPGEHVLVRWTINKRTVCPGYASRVWQGNAGFHLSEPVQATSIPKGEGVYDIPTGIPNLIPEGAATLTIRGHFDCPGQPPEYFTLGPVQLNVKEANG